LLTILRRNDDHADAGPLSEQPAAAREGLPDFETVLRLYHKRLFSLIYRLVGNMEEAADLTQQTFVNAYRAYPRFRGSPEAVFPWLCRIGVNGCKNKLRDISRRERHELRSLDEPIGREGEEMLAEIGDSTDDPALVLERRELEGKIHESIQQLPPEYRTVLVLRDMHGLSYNEIAGAVGISVELVKVRLFRARDILRRRLAHYLDA